MLDICRSWSAVRRVQSCNSTLHDIVQVLVTNANSCFSKGRTYKRGYVATAMFIKVLMLQYDKYLPVRTYMHN
jgi:hypothetical protein